MSEFVLYLQLGLEHLLDPQGYDHILFILTLVVMYPLRHFKRLLILVTAFTIGHSVTLALATYEVIKVNSDLIEFLIPVTILITALSNLISVDRTDNSRKIRTNYLLAIFFGLIHGLGFSNLLRTILGSSENIMSKLLAFNIGLEVGQIIIVVIFLVISFILVNILRVKRRDWIFIVSSASAGIAFMLLLENKIW